MCLGPVPQDVDLVRRARGPLHYTDGAQIVTIVTIVFTTIATIYGIALIAPSSSHYLLS